jgi:hypothetical protein
MLGRVSNSDEVGGQPGQQEDEEAKDEVAEPMVETCVHGEHEDRPCACMAGEAVAQPLLAVR